MKDYEIKIVNLFIILAIIAGMMVGFLTGNVIISAVLTVTAIYLLIFFNTKIKSNETKN